MEFLLEPTRYFIARRLITVNIDFKLKLYSIYQRGY